VRVDFAIQVIEFCNFIKFATTYQKFEKSKSKSFTVAAEEFPHSFGFQEFLKFFRKARLEFPSVPVLALIMF